MVKKKGALPKGTKMNLAEFNRGAMGSPTVREDASGRGKLAQGGDRRKSGYISWVDSRDNKVWVQCSDMYDPPCDLLIPEGEWMETEGPEEGQRVTFLAERPKPGIASLARQVKLQDATGKQNPKPVVWATGPTYKSSPAPATQASPTVTRLLPEVLELSLIEPPAQSLHALDFREQTKAEQTHRKIFVGGLPQSWTVTELWQLFGNVSREHVSWMAPGKQGFGWVVFRERSHARQVLGDDLERHFHVNVPKRGTRPASSARVHVKLDVKGAMPAPRPDPASRLSGQRSTAAWRLCWVGALPALMARLEREVAGALGTRMVAVEGPANINVLLQDLHPPGPPPTSPHKVVVVVSSDADAERLLSSIREAGRATFPVIVFEPAGSTLQKDWVRDPLVTTVARSADGAIDAVVTALDFAMRCTESGAQAQHSAPTNDRDSAPSAQRSSVAPAAPSDKEWSRALSPARNSGVSDGKVKTWRAVAEWDPESYPEFGSAQLGVREGEQVQVIAVDGQWVTARKGNGQLGWLPGSLFAETRDAAEAAAREDLNSRAAASSETGPGATPARHVASAPLVSWESQPWDVEKSKSWDGLTWGTDASKAASNVWEPSAKPWEGAVAVAWDADKAAQKTWTAKAPVVWDPSAKAWEPNAAAKSFARPIFDPSCAYYNTVQGFSSESARYDQPQSSSVPLVQPRYTAQNWAPTVEQTVEPKREQSNPGIKTGYAAEKEVFSKSAKDAKRAIAKHNFKPGDGQSGCLDLRMGMPLIVTHTNPESGWAYGYLVSDEAKKGWLPISYVEITSEEPLLSVPSASEELLPVVAG